jgi:hypothetical protein
MPSLPRTFGVATTASIPCRTCRTFVCSPCALLQWALAPTAGGVLILCGRPFGILLVRVGGTVEDGWRTGAGGVLLPASPACARFPACLDVTRLVPVGCRILFAVIYDGFIYLLSIVYPHLVLIIPVFLAGYGLHSGLTKHGIPTWVRSELQYSLVGDVSDVTARCDAAGHYRVDTAPTIWLNRQAAWDGAKQAALISG